MLGDKVNIGTDHGEPTVEGMCAGHGCFAGENPHISSFGDRMSEGFEALLVKGVESLMDGVFDGGPCGGGNNVRLADSVAGA